MGRISPCFRSFSSAKAARLSNCLSSLIYLGSEFLGNLQEVLEQMTLATFPVQCTVSQLAERRLELCSQDPVVAPPENVRSPETSVRDDHLIASPSAGPD